MKSGLAKHRKSGQGHNLTNTLFRCREANEEGDRVLKLRKKKKQKFYSSFAELKNEEE